MWGTTVTVNGRDYFVLGTPKTPDSELLMRAAKMAEQQESAELEARTEPYRKAVAAVTTP